MADTIKLGDYLPAPSEVPIDHVLATRQMLDTYVKSWWPELETRPNSVFGDLHLTPLAVLLSAIDIAMARRESDLNLDNLAAGIVFNENFARSYLKHFGVVAASAIPASGVVRLVFSADKVYAIDSSSVIKFGTITCRFSAEEGSPIMIYPTGTPNQRRVLTRVSDSEFVVLFPVTGAAGSLVADGIRGTMALPHPEFVRVEAAGDFDAGQGQPSLMALADQARRGFFAASLTTRTGALAFLAQRFPNLAASIVVSGDAEMLRDSSNIIGLKGGKVDCYLKSRVSPLAGSQITQLTWNPIETAWVGRLITPTPPAFFDLKLGIFRVDNFDNERSKNMIYAKSSDVDEDNLGVAYSNKEILGIKITDTDPRDVDNAFIGEITNVGGTAAQLVVQGTFRGHVFSARHRHSVRVKFETADTWVYPGTNTTVATIWATVRDEESGESARVMFRPNSVANPTAGVAVASVDYDILLGGLELSVSSAPNAFVPADLIGARFDFTYQGRTAKFDLNYRYDPSFISVADVLSSPDNQAPGVSVLAKNFVACHIKQFVVNYRVAFGSDVNLLRAKEDIFQYLNGLIYPNAYEESVIGLIMLRQGASGLIRVDKQGVIYPSLAGRFVSADGTEQVIRRELTTTLLPSMNTLGYGARNLAYLVGMENITFNATTI